MAKRIAAIDREMEELMRRHPMRHTRSFLVAFVCAFTALVTMNSSADEYVSTGVTKVSVPVTCLEPVPNAQSLCRRPSPVGVPWFTW